ncbi:MAG: FAD-dependent oxidoreductase [Anaerolineae bacterium]|nr:FAD-dependent oxidoreductase [Anaerolineae bacterium]
MERDNSDLRVAVIGAGIAGLGAAYRLQQAGCAVTVFEKAEIIGGRMQTVSMHGFTWESGAQFMVRSYYTRMIQLMKELGIPLSTHKISSLQAFLLPDGRLHRMRADSPIDVLRHPAISFRSKLRLFKVLRAAYRYRMQLDPHTPEKTASIDTESLREWGDRAIGADAVDHFLSLPASTLFFWQPEETP